jgi:hypothetical protein
MGQRLNIYIKREDEELVQEGRKSGITPSYAIIQGYKFLINKNTQYNLLMEEQETILKRLSEIKTQADGIKEEITIDPKLEDEVVESLIRAYYRNKILDPRIKETNRVKLNMNVEEFDQLLKERVIGPCEDGLIPSLDIKEKSQPLNLNKLRERAIVIFRNKNVNCERIDEEDVKLWAKRLNMEVTEFHEFLVGAGVHA